MEPTQERKVTESYSFKSLAEHWKVSPRTISRWHAEGWLQPDIILTERVRRFSSQRVREVEQQRSDKLGAA